jgi:SAM-dependent methyltransferase
MMHKESHALMAGMLNRISGKGLSVLDVGSLDVNGTFRPLVESRGWKYTGLDVTEGANVDIVASNPYRFPIADNAYDVVISGSTMEHVQAIWRWIPEVVRVLANSGFLAIHTHWKFPEHRYPVDCWRIMPDGFRYLFDDTCALSDYDIRIANDMDIVASAFKDVR